LKYDSLYIEDFVKFLRVEPLRVELNDTKTAFGSAIQTFSSYSFDDEEEYDDEDQGENRNTEHTDKMSGFSHRDSAGCGTNLMNMDKRSFGDSAQQSSAISIFRQSALNQCSDIHSSGDRSDLCHRFFKRT